MNTFLKVDQSIIESLKGIAKFFNDLTWIIQNPYGCFKIIIRGATSIVTIIAYMVCVGAIFLYAFDNKAGVKYAKIAFIVYLIFQMAEAAL